MDNGENTFPDGAVFTPSTLVGLFHRAEQLMTRGRHQHGHASHGQERVLAMLRRSGPVSQRDLMEKLGVRSASVSELLAKLEHKGLIRRERDERDRRNVIIFLTEPDRSLEDIGGAATAGNGEGVAPGGAEAVAPGGADAATPGSADAAEAGSADAAMAGSADTLFAALSDDERQQLGELLTRLVLSWEEAFGREARMGHRHGPHGPHGRHDPHGPHGPHGRHDPHGPHGPHDPHGRHDPHGCRGGMVEGRHDQGHGGGRGRQGEGHGPESGLGPHGRGGPGFGRGGRGFPGSRRPG